MTSQDFPFEACADCRAHDTAARLEQVVETTGNEVYFLDSSRARFLHANGAAARDTGYSVGELLTMGPVDLLPSYAQTSADGRFAGFFQGEKDELSTRAVVRRKDGTEYPVHLHVFRSEVRGDTIFVAVANDISARVRAEREQREREERMIQIHAAARIAAWDCDLLGGTTVLATALPGVDAMPAGDSSRTASGTPSSTPMISRM